METSKKTKLKQLDETELNFIFGGTMPNSEILFNEELVLVTNPATPVVKPGYRPPKN